MLGEIGINLAPLIAGAGIAGVALAFGTQSIVRDYLAGVFVVLEDQYGVGDEIDTGVATGTVEWVSLRMTRLRDADGVAWYVPNGEIKRVGELLASGSRRRASPTRRATETVDDAAPTPTAASRGGRGADPAGRGPERTTGNLGVPCRPPPPSSSSSGSSRSATFLILLPRIVGRH